MSELIDVLSASGLRTGEVLPRTEIHRIASRLPRLIVPAHVTSPVNSVVNQEAAAGSAWHFPGGSDPALVLSEDAERNDSGNGH